MIQPNVSTLSPVPEIASDPCATFQEILDGARSHAEVMRAMMAQYVATKGGLNHCDALARYMRIIVYIDRRRVKLHVVR
jgi:hypothetical protein